MGSLVTELLTIHENQYIVRALVQIGDRTLATGMSASSTLELAEDQARLRALQGLNIPPLHPSQAQMSAYGLQVHWSGHQGEMPDWSALRLSGYPANPAIASQAQAANSFPLSQANPALDHVPNHHDGTATPTPIAGEPAPGTQIPTVQPLADQQSHHAGTPIAAHHQAVPQPIAQQPIAQQPIAQPPITQPPTAQQADAAVTANGHEPPSPTPATAEPAAHQSNIPAAPMPSANSAADLAAAAMSANGSTAIPSLDAAQPASSEAMADEATASPSASASASMAQTPTASSPPANGIRTEAAIPFDDDGDNDEGDDDAYSSADWTQSSWDSAEASDPPLHSRPADYRSELQPLDAFEPSAPLEASGLSEPLEPSELPESHHPPAPAADTSAAPAPQPTPPKSTPAKKSKKSKSSPPPAESKNRIIDRTDEIARTDVEMIRLGWTQQDGRRYLQQTYQKRSRQHLTDQELLEFLDYLKSQPSPSESPF